MGLATITIEGNLGADAELKQIHEEQKICEFSVAVNIKRGKTERTNWYRCSLWGTRGERIVEYLTKGKNVVVSGELNPREYETDAGVKGFSLDLDVSQVSFLNAPKSSSSDSSPDESEIPF
jgi:single-strand DNA-binding protein